MPGTVLKVAKLREPVRHIPSPKSPRAIMAVVGEECAIGDSFQSFSELEEKLQIFKVKKLLASVTVNACFILQCHCLAATSLPCVLNLKSLFDPNLCNQRWTSTYSKETQRLVISYN